MRNFYKIGEGVNVAPLLFELQRQPELWDKNPARLSPLGPHFDSHDIFLRYKDDTSCYSDVSKWKSFSDEHIPNWYKSFDYLPSSRKLIFDLMSFLQGEMLGGVFIYKVEPGHKIHPHEDHGWHPEFFDKFNICLQSNPEAAFQYDNESMFQRAGDVHYFRNDIRHSVVNEGSCDHIVMTVCIRLDRGFRSQWSPEGWTLEGQVKGEKSCQQLG